VSKLIVDYKLNTEATKCLDLELHEEKLLLSGGLRAITATIMGRFEKNGLIPMSGVIKKVNTILSISLYFPETGIFFFSYKIENGTRLITKFTPGVRWDCTRQGVGHAKCSKGYSIRCAPID
jgi:hypothetical protein